ncbi:MAG: hypothetical protein ACRD12_15875 [Acidimicrobiales bacterium]
MGPRGPKILVFLRRWWPLPVLVGVSLFVQKTFFESRYDVSGHAAEHLMSATAPFFASVLVAILFWVTPGARRRVDVIVAAAAWWAATVLVLVGNVNVVDALVEAGYGHAGTDDIPVPVDHGLANGAPWLGVVAALALTAVMWRRGHVSTGVAVGAALACLIVPPWIFPGAGVLVLVIARCLRPGSYRHAS